MLRLATVMMLSMLMLLPVRADDIRIDSASIHSRNDILMLDADLDVVLNEAVIDAIDSGVEISFDLFIRVEQPREWLWSETLSSSVYRFSLHYHALSDQFLLTDVIHQRQRVLRSLDEALTALGRLRDIPVTSDKRLPTRASLEVVFSMELNIESLPAPMRPVAYLSPSWHISSDEHSVELRP